jgi:hypothetical protein
MGGVGLDAVGDSISRGVNSSDVDQFGTFVGGTSADSKNSWVTRYPNPVQPFVRGDYEIWSST